MPTNPLRPSSTPRSDHAVPETLAPNQPTTPPAAAAPPPLTLQAGARPLPDYELVRKLGAGGFGEVWQARGPGGIEVALKFIRLDACGSALELRALEVMRTIRHPNLAGLSGVWRTDQLLILAMELCDRSLQDRLHEALEQKLPGIPIRELLGYLRGAAEGLDALHDNDVQHRDVKPGNLLLLQKGVKVADFGLAKMMAETAASHTGALTLAYAAPEFFKGATTKQSDQYSLAATYVQLRTGHLLFEGSYHQVMYGHLSVSPDLSQLPAAEQAVVARALAKEPEKRWRTCKTFVNELIKAHQAAPSKPPPPLKKETPPQPRRAEKQTGSLSELLTQPTMLPPFPASRRDSAPTELRKPETPDKTRRLPTPSQGTVWLWPVLIGLFLVVLVSCGALGALSVSMGRYSKGKGKATDADLVVDLGDGAKMEFVLIDPRSKPDGGKFKMGSPAEEKGHSSDVQQHDVELTKPYYLAKYPVTQAQYQRVIGKNPSNFKDDSGRLPVEEVSWDDAQDFCKELMKQGGAQISAALRQSNYRVALPTEAQWEYACRAGTTTAYSFGADPADLGDYAWFTGNSGSRTHPVGEKQPNGWGLYDMHGNVWQWCADYYDENYYIKSRIEDPFNSKQPDPARRVLRGGCWNYGPTICRAATRNRNAPEVRLSSLGFRVCLPLD